MIRFQPHGAFKRFHPALSGLPGKPPHEIRGKRLETDPMGLLEGLHHIFRRVNASESFELRGDHALNTNGKAGHPGVAESPHGAGPVQGFGIAFERDFSVAGHAEKPGYGVQDGTHGLGREQARCASAEEDGGNRVASAGAESVRPPADFPEQGGKIAGRDRGFADGRGVKGAVQAAAAAEGAWQLGG